VRIDLFAPSDLKNDLIARSDLSTRSDLIARCEEVFLESVPQDERQQLPSGSRLRVDGSSSSSLLSLQVLEGL